MSGGSWEYFYCKLEEVADRMKCETNPNRKAFGALLKKCADAMHDIEWVDSGDSSPGDEDASIGKCLKFDSKTAMKEAFKEELDRLERFKEWLK